MTQIVTVTLVFGLLSHQMYFEHDFQKSPHLRCLFKPGERPAKVKGIKVRLNLQVLEHCLLKLYSVS